ncbi:hypothetical protein DSO57_1016005 [Entomophthora muscae]|uniref:Uncharacterized protein n=1 Tax=Entomophthora muscae TaxID=34485 RepID=A0ACC2SU07_9FUNG|nr:hypothetical protein DSO57_1016005 [Entomophthora muscae]
MNDILILVLKTQELITSSQKADQTLQTSPGPVKPLNHRLKPVNYSAIRRPTAEDPPKTTQVTQSGQETAHLLNCKPELTSYSKTRQPPKDNSPNVHQIDANLEPPKTRTYAEVAACLKEVKKPIFNPANDHQQLPVSRSEGVVQLDSNCGKFDSLKLDSLVLDTLSSTRELSAAYVHLLVFLA